MLSQDYPAVALTEPGDVVVTLTPDFGAWVDEPGYSVIVYPARGLRITPKAGMASPR